MLDEKRIQEIKERAEYVARNMYADGEKWYSHYEDDVEFLLSMANRNNRGREIGGYLGKWIQSAQFRTGRLTQRGAGRMDRGQLGKIARALC